jgi:hypothetical protein
MILLNLLKTLLLKTHKKMFLKYMICLLVILQPTLLIVHYVGILQTVNILREKLVTSVLRKFKNLMLTKNLLINIMLLNLLENLLTKNLIINKILLNLLEMLLNLLIIIKTNHYQLMLLKIKIKKVKINNMICLLVVHQPTKLIKVYA